MSLGLWCRCATRSRAADISWACRGGRARRCGRPPVEGGVGESDHDRIEPVLVDAPLRPGWRSCWATRLTGSPDTVRPLLDGVLGIPEHNNVDSLGVASAGAVASFELARRRHR